MLDAKRDAFSTQVGEFTSDFSLCSDGRMNREARSHRDLEELKKLQITLEAGLLCFIAIRRLI